MLSVLKIGGSVLRDDASFAHAARALASRLARHRDERLVVIVSAEYGATDALLAEARAVFGEPDAAALDLLWSTGELRSVARLTLHLQAHGVTAVPFNVHQTGLVAAPGGRPGSATVRPLRLLAALGGNRIVIVPGFLAVGSGGAIVSLGRGGSDLTAVLLAAALEADRCELIKDVPGYFTADPNRVSDARPIEQLTVDRALEMADGGCDLVQRHALEAARDAALVLVVRSLDDRAPITLVRAATAADHTDKHGLAEVSSATDHTDKHGLAEVASAADHTDKHGPVEFVLAERIYA
jgi:aspartate kinase